MGTRPLATTNMNISTVASLVLLAAVGTFAYPNYEDSVVPYEDFAQAPEMELETFEETDAATQFVTLALYNTISQANDFEMNQWTNDAQLTQQEFGWAKKGLQKAGSAIKKGATAVYNKGKAIVLAKAGEYCRKAIKTAAEKAPDLFKKGQAMCGSTVCPAGEKFLQGYGVPASVTAPLGKVCVKACSWAVGKIGSALSAKIADEQLGDDICKKAGVEELVQYAPQQGFVATEADVSAAMSMRIEYDFKGHSDAERYFSAAMVRDPEFIQTMMQFGWAKKKAAAAANAIKRGAKAVGGAVTKAAKWVGSKVTAGAKLVCPKAVAFAQSKAHALISKGGDLCKTALCPVIVTYVVGQTGGVGAFLAPLLRAGCSAACGWAEQKLHDSVAKMVSDPRLPQKVCDKVLRL